MKLDDIITALVLIAGFYLVFFIGKVINDLLHREYKLTEELVHKDNPALGVAMAGYYLGLVFAIGGALAGPSNGIYDDLIDLFIYGLLSVILLNVSWFLCDRMILYKFRIKDELIRDRNQGAGVVVGAMLVASGVVIFGAVAGEGGNIWTAMAFWAAGQLLFVIATWLYNLLLPYDLHGEIEKDNVAAGVSFSGILLGMGILIGFAAKRDFVSWDDFIDFCILACSGLIVLPIIRLLTDKVLLPTVKLSDEIANQEVPNNGAAYIEALSYVGAAFVVYWCV